MCAYAQDSNKVPSVEASWLMAVFDGEPLPRVVF